jgi:hypothetical protein
MEYRINRDGLLAELGIWNGFLGRSVRLIACGGTALTLLGIKDSTKDVDLMVPDVGEHKYLQSVLAKLGYTLVTAYGWARGGGFVFELFISKLFRGTSVDFDDCLALVRARHREIDFARLCSRYRETALYDVSEERVLKHLEVFVRLVRKEGFYDEDAFTA